MSGGGDAELQSGLVGLPAARGCSSQVESSHVVAIFVGRRRAAQGRCHAESPPFPCRV